MFASSLGVRKKKDVRKQDGADGVNRKGGGVGKDSGISGGSDSHSTIHEEEEEEDEEGNEDDRNR